MLIHITVIILLVNVIKSEKGYFVIIEETKIGTEITEASKLLRNKINSSSKVIIFGDTRLQRCISIQDNGRMIISQRIDREQLCQGHPAADQSSQNKCLRDLQISIISSSNKELIYMDFEIVDINDNAPTWPLPSLKVEYWESKVRKSIQLQIAHDKDAGQNALIRYYLEPGNPTNSNFDLEDAENRLMLTPRSALDYESTRFYNLSVVAEDRGTPPRSSVLVVEVTVTDYNDNYPVFVQKVFRPSMQVLETTPVDKTILVLEAKDKDSHENSRITYEIDPSMPTSVKDQFNVNRNTGEVKLKRNLDYDRGQKTFTFIVIAKDNAPVPYELSSSATVEIQVADVNDEIPMINIFVTNSPQTGVGSGVVSINLPENVRPQQYDIAHISVDDADEEDKQMINCDIDNKDSFRLQADNVKPKNFILSASKSFDREQQAVERVKITCVDNGKNENSKEIVVQITDENDNDPQFDRVFEFSVDENSTHRNDKIGTISARDKDSGLNAALRYKIASISPTPSATFHLNPDTGLLMVDQGLDRELQDHYNITVIAVDRGSQPRTGTGTIHLKVNDVNDWPPSFDVPEYNFKVSEHEATKFVIGQVRATDRDLGRNSIIKYQFISDTNTGIKWTKSIEKFEIDPDSGNIMITGHLDRETKPSYLLIVIALNPVSPARYSASITVNIVVLDYNDNPPRFASPANGSLTIIDTDRPIGSEIVHVQARDEDEHKNSNINYSIVGTTEPELFNMDSSSGILFLTKKIENYRKFRIAVQACDTGMPRLCSEYLILYITTTKPAYVDGDTNVDYTSTKVGAAESNGAIIACLVVIFVILVMAMIIMFFLIRNKQLMWKRRMENNCDKSPQLQGRNIDSNFNKKDTGSIYEADLLLLNERNKANNLMLNSMYSPKIYAESQINCKQPCYQTIDAMIASVYNPISQMPSNVDRCHMNCSPDSKSHQDLYPQHHHFRGASEPSYRYSNISGRSTSIPACPANHSYYQSVAPSGSATIRLKNNFNTVNDCFNNDLQTDYDTQTMPRSLSLMKFYEKKNEQAEVTPEKCFKYESGNRPKYVYEAFREGSFI